MRRSISTTYYALFHSILERVTDRLVGKALRGTPDYRDIYRSFGHNEVKTVCKALTRQDSNAGDDLRSIAQAFVQGLEERETADYDPIAEITYERAQLQFVLVNSVIPKLMLLHEADVMKIAVGCLGRRVRGR
ncbi:hypothetical protein [Lichenicoccus sp.]|uniref:hypothetical protein n=1 Tax=Lichenicoccus sp. TaxID=2781899 RepID=UPI003D123ACD